MSLCCWAGGHGFKLQSDQHSGSLNNWGESAAFCMGSCRCRFCRVFWIKQGKIVAYQELYCMVILLASSVQHHISSGNKKIKKHQVKYSKPKSLNIGYTFCQIFLLSLDDKHCQTWLNGNSNVALICKIVAASIAIITTSILLEIPDVERLGD